MDDVRRADVLVHVVDASGETDKEGRPSPDGEGDPVTDVAWVRVLSPLPSPLIFVGRNSPLDLSKRPSKMVCHSKKT